MDASNWEETPRQAHKPLQVLHIPSGLEYLQVPQELLDEVAEKGGLVYLA